MIKVGGRELLASHSLLVPVSERATIDMDVYGWKFQLGIAFEDDHTEQTIDVRPNETGVDLVFKRWNNTLGTSLVTPGRLAALSGGGTLELMTSNYRIGDTNQLLIQFLHNRDAT